MWFRIVRLDIVDDDATWVRYRHGGWSLIFTAFATRWIWRISRVRLSRRFIGQRCGPFRSSWVGMGIPLPFIWLVVRFRGVFQSRVPGFRGFLITRCLMDYVCFGFFQLNLSGRLLTVQTWWVRFRHGCRFFNSIAVEIRRSLRRKAG